MFFVSSKISDGNMDFRFGDTKEVSKNRNNFFEGLGINPKNIAEIQQVHGNKILYINTVPDSSEEADGLVTDNQNLYLMLKIANCMAIGFYDPKRKCIGLAHVGSKGLENGIIKNIIKSIKEDFDTNPKDLLIKISPSVGPCCYYMDIWQEAEKQLTENGILAQNIDNPKICTYHNNEYFSHRKSEDQNLPEGRFVTILAG